MPEDLGMLIPWNLGILIPEKKNLLPEKECTSSYWLRKPMVSLPSQPFEPQGDNHLVMMIHRPTATSVDTSPLTRAAYCTLVQLYVIPIKAAPLLSARLAERPTPTMINSRPAGEERRLAGCQVVSTMAIHVLMPLTAVALLRAGCAAD
ncbi:hypothetical protein Q1695_005742 [Nippostrongylus brasiliensis]|nr:hypothetical protein Q1695_005742 [Nippostrongylus brasiliensis]